MQKLGVSVRLMPSTVAAGAGLGCRLHSLGFRIQGLGFKV